MWKTGQFQRGANGRTVELGSLADTHACDHEEMRELFVKSKCTYLEYSVPELRLCCLMLESSYMRPLFHELEADTSKQTSEKHKMRSAFCNLRNVRN